ncbi:translation initiation factor IF-2 [Tellurirhabdus bombi]|uniref:translation initiation factor IF-2 n=1 Tax=Tellurirhabdus bombi TaxID=2907205 RepID=UPI001F0020E1|nr:translation initiation factor IF-2 [Tellurirhabdus bombi]
MAEDKSMRLSQVAKILNVGIGSVIKDLSAKGFKVDMNPNAKISYNQLEILSKDHKNTELLSKASAPAPKPEPVAAPAPAPVAKPTPAPQPPVAQPAPKPVEPPKPVQPTPVSVPVAKTEEPAPKPVEPAPVQAPAPAPKPVEPAPIAKVETPAPKPVESPKPTPPPVAVQPTPAPAPAPEPQPSSSPAAEKPAEPASANDLLSRPVVQGLKVLGKIDLNPSKPAQPQNREGGPRDGNRPNREGGQRDNRPNRDGGPRENRNEGGQRQGDANREGRPRDGRNEGQGQRENRPQAQPQQPRENRPVEARQQPPREEVKPPQPPQPTFEPVQEPEPELIRAQGEKLQGLKVLGTIELPSDRNKRGGAGTNESRDRDNREKRKRKRMRVPAAGQPPVQGQGSAPQGERQGQGGVNRGPENRTRDNNANPNNRNRDNNNANTPNRPQTGTNQGQGTGQNQGQGTANKAPNTNVGTGAGNKNKGRGPRDRREEPTEREVRDSIKATQARMSGGKANRGADRRRDRRSERAERERERLEAEQVEAKILKVTEFVSANDLASMMDVSVNEVIGTCMSLGMFVSINQRLDAEAITVIADEFGYDIQFVSAEDEIEAGLEEEADVEDALEPRAPIVTIMGHVDHGKTSLLDYIRRTKVAAGEAGGITQHIGAYSVETHDGRMITFLDTPGHEAFTAMRARGAKVTDVVIIVIAADDSVMPQTREAINHAQVAGVPIVFAFSKVDKPGANTEKIREELAQMNMLVEEWGGKYQTQEISSKSGMGINDLLDKVLLEAELLELKANPNKRGVGTVIEASLDKGRGYVTTMLVQSGTLKQGDVVLVGAHFGRIRAMTDDIGQRLKSAGPSTPVQILGLPGAPQAGDRFNVTETEREAREIANKREQLLREQNLRTRKHITLEEIGRRKAIGSFKELNVIVKGDVDGSVEALSDSLLKLSTEEVQVNIIQKAVGQISESDVLLASASDAIVIGFQVRPSANARRLAEQEQIEIRLYSIIYDAINEVKDAMEGLLAPTTEEVIVGNIDVREVFKISKIGTVAGCMVTEGTIKRNNKVRVIRDFIVVHTGEISALKRFKDDVNEVRNGYECGLSIKNWNDIQEGDTIESFELKEVKRTL